MQPTYLVRRTGELGDPDVLAPVVMHGLEHREQAGDVLRLVVEVDARVIVLARRAVQSRAVAVELLSSAIR